MISFLLPFLLLFAKESPPPGTMLIDNLYVDKSEIQNIAWLEYVYFQKMEIDTADWWKILPDSANVWFPSPEKRYEPITHITYQQALDYCAWRSKVVNEKFNLGVIYRLPTPEEWGKIASYELGMHRKKIEKEIKKTMKIKSADNELHFLHSTDDPDRKVLYHLFDNVSEMTSVEGMAKGGNNIQLLELEENISQTIFYEQPGAYLGFRCVADAMPK